jgi:hypothetical protein
MSLLDSIKHAGSTAAHFGGEVINDAKKVGSTVVNNTEKAGSAIVHEVQAGEHAAVKSIQFQASVVRFGLEKSFDGAKKIGATALHDAERVGSATVRLSVNAFDKITHPGNPNPPAAQGLKFSETKSASSLAYGAKAGEVYQFPDGKQWKVVDVSEDKKSGFRGVALQSTDPNDNRTIVAFAGTDPKSGKDWVADVGQGIGFQPKQYKEAVQFANKWKANAGNKVILTGHSLGGGLASYASIKTGLHATALNSAPLAINHLGGNPLRSSVRNNPKITQYYVPGEVLTNIDGKNPLDLRPGNKIAVQGKYSTLNPLAAILNHMGGSAAPGIPDPVKIR